MIARDTDLMQIEKYLRKRLSSASSDESSLADTLRVKDARTRRWVPRPFEEGMLDWRFLSEMLHELHGSPRHGNPKDPLDCLVYVMLSRKTPIPTAGKLFRKLKRKFPTWGEMAATDVDAVRGAIRGGGLEATRAKHLHGVVETLRTEFGSASLNRLRKWSNQRCLDFLTRLPGVGKKSALCVMMYGLNRKVFPADAHCIRILTRLGVLPEGLEHRPAQVQLLKKVPREYAYRLHVNLVAHGQSICTARNPRCGSCAVRQFCQSYRIKRREAWEKDKKPPTAIELFSGVGGSSLGLRNAGYRVVAALDKDDWAIRTLRLNHAELPTERVLAEDIRKPATFRKLKKLLRRQKIDVVIGGPPCQGFSMIGERIRGRNGQRFIDKPGNKLYREFVHYVNWIQPRAVVMENVPALYSFRHGYYKKQIIQDLSKKFAVEALEVDANRFGVPQRRKRVLFVGVNVRDCGGRKKAKSIVSSISTDLKDLKSYGPEVRMAIGDLPSLRQNDGREVSRRETANGRQSKYAHEMARCAPLIFNHVSRPLNVRDQLLYKLLKPGEKASDAIEKYDARHLMAYRTDIFSDKYRRLRADRAAPTIMAHLSQDGHMYIHPDPKQHRSITVREAARLQSFPDDFIFFEPRTYQFRHVGNAVPPLLAETIGMVLRKYL